MTDGWTCPRCATVHAPWVARCDCPAPTRTLTSDDHLAQLRFIVWTFGDTGRLIDGYGNPVDVTPTVYAEATA